MEEKDEGEAKEEGVATGCDFDYTCCPIKGSLRISQSSTTLALSSRTSYATTAASRFAPRISGGLGFGWVWFGWVGVGWVVGG